MDLFKDLNEAQKKAVLHKDGPLLVLAGAGAGKTRAISHRVAYLISQGVKPEEILAITFTNKAAGEMKERINSLLLVTRYSLLVTPFVSTFHSLCAWILRKSGKRIGIFKNFTILDQEDSLEAIKSAMNELKIDQKQFQPVKLQSLISKFKGDLITSEEFADTAGQDFFPKILSQVWNKYEEILKNQKSLDFDDLILKTFVLFQKDKKERQYYQNLWQYILIDEYQDTNKAQYELSKVLAGEHRNICAIGDLDQAIYSWRGADFRNIINFENDYPDHTSIVFEENYRSTQNILEAAAGVIEKNKMRKPKRLFTSNKKGTEISLYEAMDEQEEAEFVVHKIKELLFAKVKPSGIAILFRANFQSRVLEESCLKHKIPYQMLGMRFYERKEIKDIFSFLKAALNLNDLMSIKRIINVPARGIGKVTILNFFAKKELPPDTQKKVSQFLVLLNAIKEKIDGAKPSEVIRFVMKKTGIEEFLENSSDDDKARLENLKELVTIATRYDHFTPPEGIENLLTDSALLSDQDSLEKNKEAVRLMTVHSAKGLEFEYVFVVGLEDGLFPHINSRHDSGDKAEEERRLFYVAITRAKEKLFLSFSVSRMIFGAKQLNMPSQFLSDIPDHLIKLEQPIALSTIDLDL